MRFLTDIFNLIFYQPLFNFLVLLYKIIPGKDFGIVIILLTILSKIVLYPLNSKSIKSQKALSELEPKLKEIREKFKNDKKKIAEETFALYQEAKVNPFSGILLIFIQLPILIALYKTFTSFVSGQGLEYLYSFVSDPGEIRLNFLMINLAQPNFLLAVLSGLLQFWQAKTQNIKTKMGSKEAQDFSRILQKQMLYFFPFFTFIILLKMPSAIALYLITSTIISISQTIYVQKTRIKEN